MLQDFVLETCTAPGTTTTVNLAGAPAGRRSFAQAFTSGVNVYYFLDDGTQAEWGWGVFTAGSPNTITRGTVLGNTSSTTSRLNFTGSTRVYNTLPAARIPWLDSVGNLSVAGGMTANGLDAGGANVRAVGGGFGVILRNDGSKAYLLQTASGAALSTWNAFRPFSWDLTTGAVGIDDTGAGVTLGGKVSAAMGTIPVGSGMEFWGATAPAGYLLAAGQAVSRTTYAALFAVIGTTFGAGDGSTTFNLPDKRGRLSLPADNLGGTAAGRVTSGVSGVASTTLGGVGGDQGLQAHDHGVNDPGHAHGVSDPGHSHQEAGVTTNNLFGGTYLAATANASSVATTSQYTAAASTGVTVNAASTGITTQVAGPGGAQNMPPVLVCNYIIYAGA